MSYSAIFIRSLKQFQLPHPGGIILIHDRQVSVLLVKNMNFNAEEVVEIVMNDWEIGGEVVCEYSDDEFDDHDDEMLDSASSNNDDCVEDERYVV